MSSSALSIACLPLIRILDAAANPVHDEGDGAMTCRVFPILFAPGPCRCHHKSTSSGGRSPAISQVKENGKRAP
jgi:hypothetical protein